MSRIDGDNYSIRRGVPEAFSDGDIGLWLRKFEICSEANGWKEDVMLKRLLMLLSGKAFVVFERLEATKKEDYKSLNVFGKCKFW